MRTCTILVGLVTAAIMFGCMPSLHPLYSDSDIVFDEGLIGDWSEEDEEEIWTFEQGEGGGYYLTITEIEDDDEAGDVDDEDDAEGEDDDDIDDDNGGEAVALRAYVFELNGRRLIDFHADPPELSGTSYEDLMLPMHWFGTIEIADDYFDIALMEGDTLLSMIKAGVNVPAYVDMNGFPLLTAPTEELQAFVRDHMDDGLFSVKGRMYRK